VDRNCDARGADQFWTGGCNSSVSDIDRIIRGSAVVAAILDDLWLYDAPDAGT
jgi:hypothetical protein